MNSIYASQTTGVLSTREKVLRALSSVNNPDGFISGQKLADMCGVSRAAIWKAVKQLSKEGMNIEAVTNRGYHLLGTGEVLGSDAISALLPPNFSGKISVYKTIDSTNTEAKRKCLEVGPVRDSSGALTSAGLALHRSVIVAEEQTAGKGRMGRRFYSPPGSGIYLSILYSPVKGVVQPAKMTAVAAVAVCRVLKELYGVDPGIKWVNDIFIGGKKVCGILTEGVSDFENGMIELAIVGIGINICDGKGGFPPEVASVAGSVLGARACMVTRNVLAARIIREVLQIYDAEESDQRVETNSIMQEYKKYSFIIGKTVEINPVAGRVGKTYQAKIIDIDDNAGLVVQTEGGEYRTLHSGEISLRSDCFSI